MTVSSSECELMCKLYNLSEVWTSDQIASPRFRMRRSHSKTNALYQQPETINNHQSWINHYQRPWRQL